MISQIRSRSSARPSVGPYCSELARWSRAMAAQTSSNTSAGNEAVSGKPVASEMMSGRSVSDIMSRIADERMPAARDANRRS